MAAITKQNEPGGVHHQHDKGYKLLLTQKNTFIELLQSFVKEAWVNSIREDNLTRIDKSYILQDFSEKEADIVYQLQDKEKNIIFYVLLELQSEVDFLMPFRLLLYMVEIWRDFFNNTPRNERERKDFRLPCIIPAVLYNGAGKWTACTDFRETQAGYQEFGKYPLDFRYILFDVNRYDERELYNLANLIASIFILDQKHDDVKDLKTRLWNLVNTLKKMTPAEFDAVKTWLKHVFKPRFSQDMQADIEQLLDQANPEEVSDMICNLEITLEEMQRKARIEGKLEGKIEGKLEGKIEGKLEGKIEGKIEIARKMLKKKLPIAEISDLTGLSCEEVERIRL